MAKKYLVQHRRGTIQEWENDAIVPLEGEIVIEIDYINSLHKLKIGDGVHSYAELKYLQAGGDPVIQELIKILPRVVTVTLDVNRWAKNENSSACFSQTVALDKITSRSRLDLQPDTDMLNEFKELGVSFVTENQNGTLWVHSVGAKPTTTYIMQATIVETEVEVELEKIVGTPIGVTNPHKQPDWNQADPTQLDFIYNKPIFGGFAFKDVITWADLPEDVRAALDKANSALQPYTESDPTVPAWAKNPTKPTYAVNEIAGALAYTRQELTEEQKAQVRSNIGAGASSFSGDYNDLINKPFIPSVDGLVTREYVDEELSYKVDKVSGKGLSTNDFTNAYKKKIDSALQSYTESDPTVPSWAKASEKPTYTANEVGAISYNTAQNLTEAQKAQARANLGTTIGTPAPPGEDGYSPSAKVIKTGKTATITITDKTGTTTASVSDGADGVDGADGTSVAIESITESDVDGGLNVVTFSDGKTLTIKNGSSGVGSDGNDGENGISPTVAVSKIGTTTTIAITDVNGTQTATINDGEKGEDGQSCTHSWNGTTLTVTSASGTSSANLKGESGTSVVVSNVSTSSVDGGSNVVTFSDGNTLTIKNGQRGSDGSSISISSIEEVGGYQEGKVILGVEKITSDTYANGVTYVDEKFILLDIYPKPNGTVMVTYGGLTKTITDTSGAESPSAQRVFFGTFNGVSDEVITPTSGRLTIEGDYNSFGCGVFYSSGQVSTAGSCVIAVINCGHIKFIPDNAFSDCKKLTDIEIPYDVEMIGHMAFANCTSLKNVKLPDSVAHIGVMAFCNCTSLSSIVIPASVTIIEMFAFVLDSGYSRTVFMKSTIPPTFPDGEFGQFATDGTHKIVVPYGYAEIYKTTSDWSGYANYIIEGDTNNIFAEDDGSANIITFSDGKTLTIKNGTKGSTPIRGVDYYTEADKQEMINLVLAALPEWKGGSY